MISHELDDGEQVSNSVPFTKDISTSRVQTEECISLLEERLMVNLTRRKVGEVVVRKEIKTHVLQVEVPIRREKLIVEQVSPEYKRLAEIDLGQGSSFNGAITSATDDLAITQLEKNPQSISLNQGTEPKVYGETSSPQVASDLLDMIAHMPSHNCEMIRIEIVLKDSKHQDTYQALFNRNFEI
jgi:Domain of unknown function (DUF2382)